MKSIIKSKNIALLLLLALIIGCIQLVFAQKHLRFGFNVDDVVILNFYRQVVNNPFLDVFKAFKEIGVHNFAHAYYIGNFFLIYGYENIYYNLTNQFFKLVSVLSLFPIIYLLFKNRWLAFLATLILGIHYSGYGVLNNFLAGKSSLAVTCMNIFLATYIWASQKHKLDEWKIIFTLFFFLIMLAAFDVTRLYPFIFSLPLLEALNFYFNRSSTSAKKIFLRLLIFYSPFLLPGLSFRESPIKTVNFDKLIRVFDWGNFHLLITPFASFGSTFIHQDFAKYLGGINYKNWNDYLSFIFTRMVVFFTPILLVLGLLVSKRLIWFALNSLTLGVLISIFAFFAANAKPEKMAGIDPANYLVTALIGIFIFSAFVSLLIESIGRKKDVLFIGLAIAPLLTFLYIAWTWLLADDSSIFMGVHAYLNIATIGTSVFLGIFFYLAFKKIITKKNRWFSKIAPLFILVYLFIFTTVSWYEIDKSFAFWLKNGLEVSAQKKIEASFWNEVGRGKSKDGKPQLLYFDGFDDPENGQFYSNALLWKSTAMLAMERSVNYKDCEALIFKQDANKLKVEIRDGKKVIINNACGYKESVYDPDKDFFAFKLKNFDVVPNKEEVLKELGAK